jgi:hypothetical protein
MNFSEVRTRVGTACDNAAEVRVTRRRSAASRCRVIETSTRPAERLAFLPTGLQRGHYSVGGR